jgi:hypothetical protein
MNKRSKKLVVVENDSEIAGYDTILSEVIYLLESARHASARAVNVFMTSTYWLIGRRIIEWEQAGKERAAYGEALINRLSADLTKKFGRGFSRQNLQKMRLIYRIYPPEKICQTLSGKSKFVYVNKSNLQSLEKSQTVSAKYETKSKELKINNDKYVSTELKRTRTNSNCMSSFQFVPVRCLNYTKNRTRMTRIRRIFMDTFYPCVSVLSAQSVFHPKNPNNHNSAFFSVNTQFKKLNKSPQSTQRAQSIATIIFAFFALFAVRFINSLNKLSSITVPSVLIDVHPRFIDRTAMSEGR